MMRLPRPSPTGIFSRSFPPHRSHPARQAIGPDPNRAVRPPWARLAAALIGPTGSGSIHVSRFTLLSLLALFACAGLARPAAAACAGGSFPRPELARFATGVAKRDGLRRQKILAVLEQACREPSIVTLMNRPPEQVLHWWQYRRIFMTPKRIAEGAAFWRAHAAALQRIGAEQGVAPRYIVAILGVETFYGRITGSFRVLDALATLTFDYPARSRFFGQELAQFLVLTHRYGLDPLTVRGSYAGAMGPLQFIPSSYLRYAVSTDGQAPNLFTDWDDIFASVAHYLHANGWQPGGPVLARVRIEPGATFHVDPDSLALDRTIGGLAAQGVQVESAAPPNTPVALLLAERRTGPIYRAGFNNFRVLLTYNSSKLYAMAVNDLAQAIARPVAAENGTRRADVAIPQSSKSGVGGQ